MAFDSLCGRLHLPLPPSEQDLVPVPGMRNLKNQATFSKLDSALGEVAKPSRSIWQTTFCKVDGTTSGAADVSGQPVVCKPAGGLTALNVEPDRLVFKHSPDFHAENYINDPLLKAGFLNPVHLRLPKADWPRTRHARVMLFQNQVA